DSVRVIVFDRNYSVELCGGTHVQATGEIGLCRVVSESAVAAGIRRIEAYSGPAAYDFVAKELTNLKAIKGLFKNPKKLVQTVESAVNENAQLKKQIERMQMEKAGQVKNGLKSTAIAVNGVQFIGQVVDVETADMVKKIAFDLRNEVDNLFLVLGAKIGGKAHLTVMINQDLQTSKGLNASKIIRGLAKNIRGGGGGQAYYATAGGKNPDGLPQAIADAKAFVESL
ncbi:MAG: DHHA1 domain-containing protein, partial [Chitinophagales bacterium]